MSYPMHTNSQIAITDSKGQKANEANNQQQPVASEPDFLPPLAIPLAPIIDTTKATERTILEEPIIK
jgi:hypothetical protein